MSTTTDHKRTADLYRRLASIPTSGGYRADRELLALADKLDSEIAISEPGADREPAPTNRPALDYRAGADVVLSHAED